MKKLGYVILFGVVLILTACGGNNSSSNSAPLVIATVPAEFAGRTNPLGESAAADGATVFKDNCVACHGEMGYGDGPASQSLDPKPANLITVSKQVGDDYLFWRVSEGKLGTAMVAWKGILTDEQIWQVVTYIRTLK